MKTKILGRMRVPGALLLTAALAACGQVPLHFLQPQRSGLQALTQQIGLDAGTLRFDFEFDDKADAVEGEVGSGYIVVSRDGKELQALPHAFELPRERLDPACTRLTALGMELGARESFWKGAAANQYVPRLHSHDRYGRRRDEIEYLGFIV